MWTTRKLWDAQRLLMIGPPCPAPVSSLVPVPPVYQVSSAVHQHKYWDMRQYLILTGLCIVVYETDYWVSMFACLFDFWFLYSFMSIESQSNHSSQSDSGVSETTSSGHVRSQSVVSSIFSEAWKRGNQADEPKVTIEEIHFKSLLALLRSSSVSSSYSHCHVS